MKRKTAKARGAAKPRAPKHVVILGLGPSLERYVDTVKRLGSRHAFADEVWGINAVGDAVICDRIFHMDDVRIQEIRAKARPKSNIAAMLSWIKSHPGPIYTCRAHPDYPGLVEYPLRDVIQTCDMVYFNSTAAYAVAYAVHIGVEKISMFGCDFTYASSHDAEKGRGCVEFYLGMAKARGIKIAIPAETSLLDACEPLSNRLYGFCDTRSPDITRDGSGKIQIAFTPLEKLPTADEIEARYDHSKHSNPLISGN